MVKIKKVGILSFAKINALVMAAMGLIVAVIYLLIFLPFLMLASGAAKGVISIGLGVAIPIALIGIPVFYGIIGFIFGALGAWLYNIIAGWIGGLEMNLEK